MAAARDKLFPASFSKVSKNGIPIIGIIIASILASILVGMNFTKGLIDKFLFITKLATLTCLLPYLLSAGIPIFIYMKLTFKKQ